MWVGLLIIILIALVIGGVIAGTLWFAIPVVLLTIALAAAYLASMRSERDEVGRVESGPTPRSERERPEDEPGGPEHESTGYAHRGQARMTP